jgi:HK97 family phage major capsid protein
MPVYNSVISRTDAEALIPEQVSQEIVKHVPQQSVFLRMARRLPNMSSKKTRMPVLAALVSAYFVNGDTGLKQTTRSQWENKYIEAEELAAIVPIPEAVLDDSEYDVWGELRPLLIEALGVAIDQAVFYGTNAPSSWPTAIVTSAAAAGHTVTLGAGADIYDDIMADGGVLSKVEADGFAVTGHVAALSMKAKLRGLRDGATGVPIFSRTPQAATPYELDGVPMDFPTNGSVDPATSLLISGDYQQAMYSIRQDVTYKVLDQAVIQDGAGAIIYNLAQQDMVALRVTMRLGWQLPNPVNRVQAVAANRYPFAVLLP